MKKITCLFLVYVLMLIGVNAQENVTVTTTNLNVSKDNDAIFRINFNELNGVAVAGLINIESEDTNIATVDIDKYFFDTGLDGNQKYLDITVHGVAYGSTNINVLLTDVVTFDDEQIQGTITVNLTVTKEDAVCPTITAYNGTYDGNSHKVTLNGGSGGTIQYRTSTTGTWSNTEPTRKDQGTTTVYVQVLGDENHNTVDCGSNKITINKKSVTVTADNKIMNYGGTIPSNSYTITGAIGSENAVSGTASYIVKNGNGETVSVNSNLNAGNYTIIPSGLTAGTNYTITYANGTLTVNKVKAEITCSNKNYTGSTLTIASCQGGTISGANHVDVGEYDIQCTGDSNHFDATITKCQIIDTPIVTTSEATVTDSEVIFEISYNYNLSYSEMKRRLNKNNLEVYDINNNLVTTDSKNVGTGGKIKSLGNYYDIIVKGDVNGDAKISMNDYLSIRKHILGTALITDPVVKKASDMNGDNQIKTMDYIAIRKIMMKG